MQLEEKFIDLYDGTMTDEIKNNLKKDICGLLQDIVNIEDDVIPDYICLMVVNGKKSMNDIKTDLVEFFGEEMALQFTLTLIKALEKYLPTVETSSSGHAVIEKTQEKPKQKIVSLKSVKSTAPPTNHEEKTKDTGGRIVNLKSLKGSATDEKRLDERRKRWGIASPKDKSDRKGRSKSNEKDRKITSKLGPPVSIEQAEMDVRSTIGSSKRKHSPKTEQEEPKPKQHQTNPPPNPYYPPRGMYPPQYPYGSGPGMDYISPPPYHGYGAYGYPPRQMRPPRGRGPPRGHYNGNNWGGNAPEGKTDENDSNGTAEQPNHAPHMPPQHSPYHYAPRPYSYYGGRGGYGGGYAPRPRAKFANKTWVRPDAPKTETPSTEQAQKLSDSLPTTPPQAT